MMMRLTSNLQYGFKFRNWIAVTYLNYFSQGQNEVFSIFMLIKRKIINTHQEKLECY